MTARIAVTINVDVDVDAYAETYGITDTERAESDAAEYLERIVSEAVQHMVGPLSLLDWGAVYSVTSEGVGEGDELDV
jgi:hypothetical protein